MKRNRQIERLVRSVLCPTHAHEEPCVSFISIPGHYEMNALRGLHCITGKAGPSRASKIKITHGTKYLESFCRKEERISIPCAMRIHL